MKTFKFAAVIFTVMFAIAGCKKSIDLKPKDAMWDREPCARCTMKVCDRLHSAQIVNPEDGSRYYFDDMGCAVLWLEENNFTWKNSVVMYITDGLTGSWINKDEAFYATGFVTPMSFGIAAFKNKGDIQPGKEALGYEEARGIFIDIKKTRMNKKSAEKM